MRSVGRRSALPAVVSALVPDTRTHAPSAVTLRCVASSRFPPTRPSPRARAPVFASCRVSRLAEANLTFLASSIHPPNPFIPQQQPEHCTVTVFASIQLPRRSLSSLSLLPPCSLSAGRDKSPTISSSQLNERASSPTNLTSSA